MTDSPLQQRPDLSTEEITELEAHIQCRLNGQVRDFRLEVGKCGLILRGRSRTYYAKQLAQHVVMAACRLPIAANEIDVS